MENILDEYAYSRGYADGARRARAEVIADLKRIWVDEFGEADSPILNFLLPKLERAAE